jgi:hypothetical protein
MPAHIDPATGNLIGYDPEAMLTASEVLAARIPCPRCGTRVSVQPRDLGSLETVGDRHYTHGRHAFNCPCY